MRIRASAPPALAVALLVGAFFLPDPREGARDPRSVAVHRAAYACPADVNVAAGQIAPARAVRAVRVPGGGHVAKLEQVDRWRLTKTTRSTVVEQSGRGSGGAGFFTATAGEADGGGLMVASCPPTVDESWFLGLGSGAKHESRLELTNLSDIIAVADISLWGEDGPIEEVGAEGIVIQPQQSKSLDVSTLADGEPELAVRVERRRGAFAVTAFDGSRRVSGGSEAPAPTRAPRRDQIVAGLPAGAPDRTLLVINPSSTTSRLSVSVLGRRGTYAPRGLEAVRVPAGRVTALPLPAGLGADGLSLRITSEQPVAVVARVAESKDDYAYIGSVHQLEGPALVPVDLGGGTSRPRLTLTAPTGRATVTVKGFDAGMKQLAVERHEVPAGSTSTVALTSLTDSDRLAYVVVEPTGDVVGSATFRKDEDIAVIPLEAAPVRVLGPDVRLVG
ncbi:MAG TPA: DUF5719 family protein [Aeromicrobium sp.]|nr:DUF5719 family protein [Aeromicrobium sp.]